MMKIQRLILIAITWLFCSSAQQISAQGWERIYPAETPSSGALFRQALPTPDGGYIAIGDVYLPTGAPRNYIRLVKVDGQGGKQWEKSYFEGEIREDKATGLALAPDGGYFAFGATRGADAAGTETLLLLRLDAAGDTLWTRQYLPDDASWATSACLRPMADGNLLLLGSTQNFPDSSIGAYLLMVDGQGAPLWEKHYQWQSFFNPVALEKISPLPGGGFVACGAWRNNPGQPSVVRFDEQGELLWERAFTFSPGDELWDVKPTADGGFLACGSMTGIIANYPVVIKLDADGNELWEHIYDLQFAKAVSLAPTLDGGFILAGSLHHFWYPTTPTGFLLKINAEDGVEQWQRNFSMPSSNGASLASVLPAADGGYIAAGALDWQAFLVKTDANGLSITNFIHGNIFRDADLDCAYGADEDGFYGWKVKIEGNGQTLFASADTSGYYSLAVDTGTYTLSLLLPNALWEACEEMATVNFQTPFDTLAVDFALQPVVECPLMQVDISVPFLRRCFDNTYVVHYCNEGTLPADGAAVEVELDAYLSIVSAELPYQALGNNRYRFELGDVPINTCDFFRFTVYLDCDGTVLGQTHCVEAAIFPDTLCLPLPAVVPVLEIEASCSGDSVYFLLQNLSPVDMAVPAEYIVIEDDVMFTPQPFQLAAGGTLLVAQPANGSTYRLEVPQQPSLVESNQISATLEGCGVNSAGGFSTGFVNQFPLLTGSPFVDIECRENIGAYDPNDKQALPRGYGPLHYLKPDTDIEYHIRFQNTGTDTAFTVVIRDTLSAWLDPGSVKPGAASHPYRWQLSGEGVLSFTFDQIMLPDSNVNEPASHGFVKFFVSQYLGNPLGIRIENRAGIYFDFNAPIITNTAFHTLGKDFVEIISSDDQGPGRPGGLSVRLMPNPASEWVSISVEGLAAPQSTFYLYYADGALALRQPFQGPLLHLPLAGLPGGIYFFFIEAGGSRVGSGKLVVGKH
jgi:outer membrane protein assembly factor BamB